MIFYNIKRKTNEIFFSKEPDWYWGLFCILFSVIIIDYTLMKKLSVTYHHLYYPLPLFEFFHIPDPLLAKAIIEKSLHLTLPLSSLFFSLKIFFIVSLICSLLGAFQRFFVSLSLISFFLFQGWLYGYIRTATDPYVYHSANIVCFIFLVWLFSPPCKRWTALFWLKRFFRRNKNTKEVSITNYPVWPRLLVILTIGIVFFSSFYCKFDTSGFKWINGYTLQGRLLEAYALHFTSRAYWLAQQNFYLIWFLNIGVWVFQFTAPVGYLLKRTRLLYAFVGTIFHIFIILFFGFWFVPFQYCYIVFIPEAVQFFKMLYKKWMT